VQSAFTEGRRFQKQLHATSVGFQKKKMSMEGKVMVKDYYRKREKKSHKSLVLVIKK